MVHLAYLHAQLWVLSVAVSPDGAWVVSGSEDHGVQFWNSKDAQTQLMLQGHTNAVLSIDLSPAGGLLATGSRDGRARVCEWLISICLWPLLVSPETFGMVLLVDLD